MDRCPAGLLERLEQMRQAYLEKAEVRCATEDKTEVFVDLGARYAQRALNMLHSSQADFASQHSAMCCKHSSMRSIFPPPPAGFKGLVCSVAGVNCYDFSCMGLGKRFLGPSVVPFVIWLWERLMSEEDFFIVECTPVFDDMLLSQLLRGVYNLACLKVCPSLFGLPMTRDRKYMIATAKSMQWDSEVLAVGHQQAFERLLARQVEMQGDEMLRAPADEISKFVAALAAVRKLPPKRSSNTDWSCFLAMSRGLQNSVSEHEAALTSAGFAPTSPVLSNLFFQGMCQPC